MFIYIYDIIKRYGTDAIINSDRKIYIITEEKLISININDILNCGINKERIFDMINQMVIYK